MGSEGPGLAIDAPGENLAIYRELELTGALRNYALPPQPATSLSAAQERERVPAVGPRQAFFQQIREHGDGFFLTSAIPVEYHRLPVAGHEQLGRQGLVDLSAQNDDSCDCIITVDGYTHLSDLERHTVDSTQAFVAMWFDPDMRHVYDSAIKPALEDANAAISRLLAQEQRRRLSRSHPGFDGVDPALTNWDPEQHDAAVRRGGRELGERQDAVGRRVAGADHHRRREIDQPEQPRHRNRLGNVREGEPHGHAAGVRLRTGRGLRPDRGLSQ